MARWDVYNVIGDDSFLLDYEVESRDFDWTQKVNPTPDVGLAFRTVVRSLSEEEKKWTTELFELIGQNGGGRILRYEGSSSDASVTCYDLRVDEDGESERVQSWYGRNKPILRVDENTLYDRSKHKTWDDDLTIKGVPFSMGNVDDISRFDLRFHNPLLKVIEEETGLKTVYEGHWSHGWQTAGELPECVYQIKEVPDHMKP